MLAPIFYYLIIFPITRLPFRALYILSDFLFYISFYLIQYRKKVVYTNLRNSFPNKSIKEIDEIGKKFYRHFCDLTVESFKMFSITEAELEKRFTFSKKEIIDKLYKENRNVILAGGHYNNWEVFAVACKMGVPHNCIALYAPIKNKWFDKKMRESRGRFGLQLWSTKMVKEMFEHEKDELSVAIFGMDQSPSNPDRCYWMKFLNQETGVSFGSEKYAKENNSAVVYGRILKVKRGHYTFESELITENPKDEPPGKILFDLTKKLEIDIINQPEYWLWSHRRWKRKRPEHMELATL